MEGGRELNMGIRFSWNDFMMLHSVVHMKSEN